MKHKKNVIYTELTTFKSILRNIFTYLRKCLHFLLVYYNQVMFIDYKYFDIVKLT